MSALHPNLQTLPDPAAALQAVLARHRTDPHQLVQILRELQALRGWLPREDLSRVAAALGLTLAHVEGVAGFYRFFHTDRSVPTVCCSATTSPTACWALMP